VQVSGGLASEVIGAARSCAGDQVPRKKLIRQGGVYLGHSQVILVNRRNKRLAGEAGFPTVPVSGVCSVLITYHNYDRTVFYDHWSKKVGF